MKRFQEGDRVRIDIPDVTDPDHEVYHGREGQAVDVDQGTAGMETGDKRDNLSYLVKFNLPERVCIFGEHSGSNTNRYFNIVWFSINN